jgi:protein gp37
MKIEWVHELRDRCDDEQVAFFFKQWGGRLSLYATYMA